MTDIEKNGPVSPTEPEPKSLPSRLGGRDRLLRSGDEGRPASHRRTISAAMMQALEDDMDRRPGVYSAWRPAEAPEALEMAPDALRMLARLPRTPIRGQLRRDPNPDAIEDAACALEAIAIERERPPGAAESSLGANSGLSRPNGLSPGSPSAFRASAVAFAGPS